MAHAGLSGRLNKKATAPMSVESAYLHWYHCSATLLPPQAGFGGQLGGMWELFIPERSVQPGFPALNSWPGGDLHSAIVGAAGQPPAQVPWLYFE